MLGRIAIRADLAVVALLILTVLLMVLPLPTQVVDVLLATNMAISVLLLMTAFYLRTPVQFSTLPAIILIATVFRLALSIAVTRLVLLQADAGQIIRAFGEFVVAGNIVIGLVIFLIITVVQFVVITKGGERVAEVAARFTLDALPGKQMAIDADVRSNDIDQAEARRRRMALERESQLYGAMDGAMKFVKGDAIAGLVIIVVNLLGGLAVGVLQHGMTLADATQTYSILTVGDGLVAQIPALFVAITAGTVVTRVSGGEADSLGGEIAEQVGSDPRALALAGVVAMLLGLVPGLPTVVFFGLALGLFALARFVKRRDARARDAVQEPLAASPIQPPAPPARVQLMLSASLAGSVDRASMAAWLGQRMARLSEEVGIDIPPAQLRTLDGLEGVRFRLDIDAVPVVEGALPPDGVLLRDEPENAELAGVALERGDPLPGQQVTLWAARRDQAALASAGIGHAEAAEALVDAVAFTLRRHASQFVGIQETQQLLARMEAMWGELVRETKRLVPLQRIADLLRRLLEEGISLRNLRGILEAVVEHGAQQDVALLTEAVRGVLRRQVCHGHADSNRIIAAYMLDADAEAAIRGSLRQTPAGLILALPEGTTTALIERIRGLWAASRAPMPVLLTAADIRRHVRGLLVNNGIDAAVLSFNDLLPEFVVQPLGAVRVLAHEVRQPGGGASPMRAAAEKVE